MPFFQPPRPTGTPPIFPNGNTGGEDCKVTCYPYAVFQLPVMPQDTAEGKGYIRYKLIDVVFNPSVTACHLPYILLCKTQGEEVNPHKSPKG